MDIKQTMLRFAPPPGTERHVAWVARSFGRRDFPTLQPDDIRALGSTLTSQRFAAGEPIHPAGAPSSRAYIVEDGEVELHVRRGRTRTLVAIQRSGGVFGDVPLLCDMPFPYQATARTDTTLLIIERDALLALLSTHPGIALRWLTSVIRRLEHANRRIVALTVGDVRARLLALLRDEVLTGGDAHVRLTQAEMAALLGATRQSVNRALAALAEDGLVTTDYGGLTVTDVERLMSLTGQTLDAH